MSEAILSGQGLAKTYREGDLVTPVFSGLDIAVRAGESLAVVGASGSGKSTLLHLLAGLDRPTEGHVRLLGEDLYRHSEAALGRLRSRHLGFIYQFHHLLPEFSALENVMMPLLIAGQGSRQATVPAQAVLEQVGLGHRLRHKPGELSGGERQRVAVARALVNRPACVLADEPTGNLDPANAARVLALLGERIRAAGAIGILVTHSQEAAATADRVLRLSPDGLGA